MNNNQTIYNINYQIEQLQKQKEELKKENANNKIKEFTALIQEQNNQSPLTNRELENILKAFYYDIKNIIED